VPGWYQDLKALQASGKIQIVGLIQEQHPERCKLFMEWKKLDFPILVDSLNRLEVTAIPKMWALADQSLVIETRPKMEWIRGEFLELAYPAMIIENPEPKESRAVQAYLDQEWSKAIDSFSLDCNAASVKDPKDGRPYFRLGCAYRARHDSKDRQPGDFQRAIDMWTQAIRIDPGNYIYQRRLQQYGPRLMKPYPFYDWIDDARRDIEKRGDKVPPLLVEPRGAELAGPSRKPIEASTVKEENPDPEGKMPFDSLGYVKIESVVAPYPARAGATVAVHMDLRLNKKLGTTWDNEGGPLQIWLAKGDGYTLAKQLWKSPLPHQPGSAENRVYDFEVGLATSKEAGKTKIAGFAVYFVCEKKSGVCTFARQNFSIEILFVKAREKTQRRRRR